MAFRTNQGLFKPTVMFFGLMNLPTTFQAMMNTLFHDLIQQGKVVIYLDDILIFMKDIMEHHIIVKEVLKILRENKLYLKPAKCKMEKEEIKYLEMIMGHGKVWMDLMKVDTVRNWQEPRTKKELQMFLGYANFYRHFIKGFSSVVKPLTKLMGNKPWKWGEEQTKAFDELKARVCSEPVIAILVDNAPYRVEADASDYAAGAVLSQKQEGKWHPIAYMSKVFSDIKRNYEIYDKEMLTIMLTLGEWQQYLMGTMEDFEIWTDHQNLQYFQKPQKLNR